MGDENLTPISELWSVYLVLTRFNTLYCGISNDVARRFQEHCAGAPKGAKALRGKGPLQLVYQQEIGTRSLASRVESRVKKLPRATKDRLMREDSDLVEYFRLLDSRSSD
jgi:putative endonuclease